MSGQIAIRVDAVSKLYGDFKAVADLSFEVPTGQIYGVLGPNGAGKSTTLRMLNDIIAPDVGSIELLGRFRPGTQAASHIGYLPEERGLYAKMRAAETLVFFGELRGLDAATARRRAGQWLDRLGLGDWADHPVQDLSKGMQQKVQFATALIHDPELLILDEPWSGLDPLNADVLRDIVREHRERGHTVLFSTHLMEQAEQICDRVCIIAGGRKVLEGELATLRREATRAGVVTVMFGSAADAERARTELSPESSLCTEVRVDPERCECIEVSLAEGAEPDALLRTLVDTGLSVRRFEAQEPSLHQIFVDRVGAAAAPRNPEERDG